MVDSEKTLTCLTDLLPGQCGVIAQVADREELERLKAMGVCLGRRIELIKKGDPLILRVFGTRIGLSHRFAADVQVLPCPAAPRCWEQCQQISGKAE